MKACVLLNLRVMFSLGMRLSVLVLQRMLLLFTENTARRVGFSLSIFASPLLSLSKRKGSSGTVSSVQYYCIIRIWIIHKCLVFSFLHRVNTNLFVKLFFVFTKKDWFDHWIPVSTALKDELFFPLKTLFFK